MTTPTKIFILALIFGAIASVESEAQTTYPASSCAESAVQSAYTTEQAKKADGDIITIPSCSSTGWSSSWTISPTNSLTFEGNSTVAGNCTPSSSACTTTDSTIISFGNAVQWTISVASGKTIRVTGMTINPSGSTAEYGSITTKNTVGNIRFDHDHFNDTISGDHTFNSDGMALFDHDFFDSTNQSNLFFIQPTNNGTDGEANAIWTVADEAGTANYVIVENCLFQNGAFAYDDDFGGRITFRFNIVGTNTRLQSHGTGSGAQRRGGRMQEVYGNSFTFSSNPNTDSFAFLQDFESGDGFWFENTISGFSTFLREDEIRTNTATYTQTPTPNGWGYCGTSASGTGSNWDENSNTTTGYACLDQIGRGAEQQLLTGSFPNLINSILGTIAWPNQALDPIYAFDNTLNTNSYAPNHYWVDYESPSPVVENRDYYLQLPNVDEKATFSGTAGIGQGALASKPSTCTPSVGWWATDQGSWNQSGNGTGSGVLYVCTATNTWTAYYTPYAYPDPLESTTPAPAPPTITNTQAVPQ